MKQSSERLSIHWDVDEEGYKWPTLRGTDGELLEPFTSYLESLVRKMKSNSIKIKSADSKIQPPTYALSGLIEFLFDEESKLYRLDDGRLERLRNYFLAGIRNNPISRGSSHGTKRTANSKLEEIYRFLDWCQVERRLPRNTIGWEHCRVRSSLPNLRSRPAIQDSFHKHLYPTCYQGVGQTSRRKEGQYWATAEDLIDIENHFWETNTFSIAERNTLALRLHHYTAWRIESVNSLTVDLFTEQALQKSRKNLFALICPPGQKFGYEKDFAVDWILIDRIVEYIKNGRKELLSQAGVTEKETEGRLFVSQGGRPLDDRGYGEIFSDAFTAIGAPKGSGAHAIRRYRTQLEVIREITRRRAAGLPIIREEVCRVVMDLLGHTSEEAGRSYDRVSERLRFEAEENGIAQRLEKTELERDSLRAVLAHLRNKLPRELLKDLPPSLVKLTDIKLGRPASSLSAMTEGA